MKATRTEDLPSKGKEVRLKMKSEIKIPSQMPKWFSNNDETNDDSFPFDIEEAAEQFLDSIKSKHGDRDESINHVLTAYYSDMGERIVISYDESELIGERGVLTQVTFLKSNPQVITIIRSGPLSATIVLEIGKRHTGEYKLGNISFVLSTTALKIENEISNGVGILTMKYITEISGLEKQLTDMTLQIN